MYTSLKRGDVVVRVKRGGQPLASSEELEVKVVERVGEIKVRLEHPVPMQSLSGWTGRVVDHEYGHQGWSGTSFATASGIIFQDGTEGLLQDFVLACDHYRATRDRITDMAKRNSALYNEIHEKALVSQTCQSA